MEREDIKKSNKTNYLNIYGKNFSANRIAKLLALQWYGDIVTNNERRFSPDEFIKELKRELKYVREDIVANVT